MNFPQAILRASVLKTFFCWLIFLTDDGYI